MASFIQADIVPATVQQGHAGSHYSQLRSVYSADTRHSRESALTRWIGCGAFLSSWEQLGQLLYRAQCRKLYLDIAGSARRKPATPRMMRPTLRA